MAPQPLFQKKALAFALFLASLCFGGGFVISFQDEMQRYEEMGHVAQDHLAYAFQLKDDMSVIDWAKGLEKIGSILAFRAAVGSKVLAEGGNRDRLTTPSSIGTSYQFPSQWSYQSALRQSGTTEAVLTTIVFRTSTGPFVWGLSMAAASLLTSLLLNLWLSSARISPKPESALEEEPMAKTPTKGLEPIFSRVDPKDEHVIFIDREYVVQEATSKAVQILGRTTNGLIGSHLLDLLPGPSLMQAIERAQETTVEKAFPSHPMISVQLRPSPKGTLLILEDKGR